MRLKAYCQKMALVKIFIKSRNYLKEIPAECVLIMEK